MTFAGNTYKFYKNLDSPRKLPQGIEVMNPYKNKATLDLTKKFLYKYFDDNNKRIVVLGINPGRFGGGYSGINFTDGYALEKYCAIENDLIKKRELSSVFIYNFIEKWGGANKFYKNFFLSAISPLGFTKNWLNYNYYDNLELLSNIKNFIISSLEKQLEFGADRKAVIIFGTGKNLKFFNSLNKEHKFFKNVLPLEHPRFIMQYKRKFISSFLEKYIKVFEKALNL